MRQSGSRVCDVCGQAIPPRETYQTVTIPAGAAASLLEVREPDLVPTWTELPNGKVRLDICSTCTVSMGPLSSDSDPN